ncbi:EpsG family protein [Mangrovimicrobium sediminis]|uniref:EpsG family protein n=1 Tax=Mangrovimicrobium sediminis TaxID=2562682 RepID=A0A4Z0M0B9_9GAMM|nr:EpsG family protein [Haliea sp. SAOS-164]TGD73113.1 EpsG family protein [Haliea sp. SAOS-164]
MIVYLGIYLALVFLAGAVTSARGQQWVLALCVIGLAVFVGTRFDTGCDFDGYLYRFRYMFLDTSQSLLDRPEPGYYLLTWLIKVAGLSYLWVNVAAAAVFFGLLWHFVRRHPNALLMLALMFPVLVIQLAMSGVRQAVAVAFLTAALTAFTRNQRSVVVLCILAAGSFHSSALVFLPLALMVGRDYSTGRVLGALLLLTPVAYVLMQERLQIYHQRYIMAGDDMYSSGAIYRVALIVGSAAVFELYRRRFAQAFPAQFTLLHVFSLASFFLVPAYLVNTVMAHRLAYYLIPAQAFVLAALPGLAGPLNGRDSRLLFFAITGVYLAYMLVWFGFSRHAQSCYVPYQSFLFH